ncbi:MAG: hypothetical protein QOF82_1094, partial [Frankiales bacterium]|nr:hypothetical protein [Frankiales bacterium]
APRPGTSVPSLVVPAQLPLQIGAFTGRAGALAQLDQVLADPAGRPAAVVISAVFGTPGVGKTALAVHWAHRVAGQFPDGQLYVNLRGFDSSGPAMTPAEGLRGFLDALAVPPQRIPADLGAQAALFRSTLAGKRVLVVLDNARDAEQVRPLLPGTPGCLVLVTSRNQLTSLVAAEGAHAVALDLLTVEEARQLLAARIGAGRIAAEPEAVSEIIARCARLPLALAIIAARAAAHPGFPLAALTHELRNAQDGRDALDALDGGDAAMNVQAVFSWSYQTLGTDAARLFRLLGLHPGPDFATSAAASLAGIPVERARPLLAELIRVSLVTEHIPGRFSFHDLLRSYATGQAHALCTEDERRVAVHRMLDHYLHTAHTASMILNPARYLVALAPARPGVTVDGLAGYPQALAWFTAEHAVLEAAIGSVSDTEFAAWSWQLAWTLTNFLDRRGHWRELAQIQRTALAVAQRLGDLRGQAHARHSLALACSRLGHHDDACTHLQHALDLFGALGDRIGEAHTHWFCSHVAEQRARPLEALNHAQQALGLYRLAGHRAGHAATLNAVGWYHARLGNYRQALADCEQALDLQRDLGDRYNEASTWGSLGYAHHHLGNLQQAIDCYQHSLSLMRAVGYRHDEAELLLNLGDTHHAAGDTAPARDAWQQALEILDQLGHPNAGQIRARLHALDAQ